MTDQQLQVTQPDNAALSTDRLSGWRQAADAWLLNFRSDRTRRAYGGAWKDFLAFAQTGPEEVTQDHVIAYKVHLLTTNSPKTGKPVSQSTINQRLSALSSFFNWAAKRGLRADNPVNGVTREAVNPYGKATWLDPETGEDLKLLQAIDAGTDQGKRDRAIILTMLTLALRVAAFPQLSVGSVRRQGDKAFLTYQNKGGETVAEELPPETLEAIDDYLTSRSGLTNDAPLFVATAQGRKAAQALAAYRGQALADEDQPLTARAIRYLVKSYCDKVFGPGHGIHPHSLRHTAAQAAIEEGRSVTEVSNLLKHKNIGITTVYLHATSQAGAKAAKALGRRYGNRANGPARPA